ncbi:hypothetical protein GUITHDRAFT_101593 [Guillardia theta CCMP2712]|uniref:VPS9 domain-containing protein n=1 Tax=Guillardia theta (strain CCMP2712) TaxID=905079 RepID=L1JV29_GUITC|nr:hypothetical protein GUITHDRAFT_101593 [Guillardia theta CCMP2712]EKX52421.1 hypothetical protein GUITHDRAFT_101593 [Guillardia theta CCMP2712]|eukprot:XP_005839401.1 hypothetical protein GUITHDRAFT_101593 [Guillardia theta CCMP2712]
MYSNSPTKALSREEWQALEQSSLKAVGTIVGSLKTILGEVQSAIDGNSFHQNNNSGDLYSEGKRHEETEVQDSFQALAQQRKSDYEDFIACMRQANAWDLRTRLQRFVKTFNEGPRYSRDVSREVVQNFLIDMENWMLQHPIWMNRTAELQIRALDSLEQYVTTRIHKRIFAPDMMSRKRDSELRMRIARLRFIGPDHLDIPATNRNDESWEKSVKALQVMSERTSPIEKLDCILEASRHICSAPTLNGLHTTVSADDFLPVLVYIVLRANPSELPSNIDFISDYRSRSRNVGEAAYFFTHLAGALHFIETLDATRLSIEPSLFDRLMESEDENIYSFVTDLSSIKITPEIDVSSQDFPPTSTNSSADAGAGSEHGESDPNGSSHSLDELESDWEQKHILEAGDGENGDPSGAGETSRSNAGGGLQQQSPPRWSMKPQLSKHLKPTVQIASSPSILGSTVEYSPGPQDSPQKLGKKKTLAELGLLDSVDRRFGEEGEGLGWLMMSGAAAGSKT